jgi:geranylgeranyl pyrophosphate synthase
MESENFANFLKHCQQRVNRKLTCVLNEKNDGNSLLNEAIIYSVLNGGKRLRPTLTYATAQALGGLTEDTDLVAMAVELIHSYSLIHDDLPSMDDDSLRRNQPTCHVVFGEALAILAGDALQSLAFIQLTKLNKVSPEISLTLVSSLANAAGPEGMVKGQAIDINSVNRFLTLEELELMHHKKTGALILASIIMGALSTGKASKLQLDALKNYGISIGLAFQVQDDILDVSGDTKIIGKVAGSDQALNKATYVKLLGLDGARKKALQLHESAIAALEIFDDNAKQLRAIADYVISRKF